MVAEGFTLRDGAAMSREWTKIHEWSRRQARFARIHSGPLCFPPAEIAAIWGFGRS
jgi:hypothetical protein